MTFRHARVNDARVVKGPQVTPGTPRTPGTMCTNIHGNTFTTGLEEHYVSILFGFEPVTWNRFDALALV